MRHTSATPAPMSTPSTRLPAIFSGKPRSILIPAPCSPARRLLFKDRLYVPVSSSEESRLSTLATYSCCTFRGSVVALDAATGKIIWKAFAIERAATLRQKRTVPARTMYGPAGRGSAGRLPPSTPNATVFTSPPAIPTPTSQEDGIGRDDCGGPRKRSHPVAPQVTEQRQRSFRLHLRTQARQLPNDPRPRLRFRRLANSPATCRTARTSSRRDRNPASVFGIDPVSGAVLWRTQVGAGGFLAASSGEWPPMRSYLYVANADVITPEQRPPRPLRFKPRDR